MDEVRAILNAPDLTTRLGLRDRAMLHLWFTGGLRVSELIGVLLENVSLGRTPSVMVRGKGRRGAVFRSGRSLDTTCGPGSRL